MGLWCCYRTVGSQWCGRFVSMLRTCVLDVWITSCILPFVFLSSSVFAFLYSFLPSFYVLFFCPLISPPPPPPPPTPFLPLPFFLFSFFFVVLYCLLSFLFLPTYIAFCFPFVPPPPPPHPVVPSTFFFFFFVLFFAPAAVVLSLYAHLYCHLSSF